MIVVDDDDDEAVTFDIPTNDQTSIELIEYLMNKMNLSIGALVVTYFHRDCLGGLQVFHKYDISSYAKNQTIILAKKVRQMYQNKVLTSDIRLMLVRKKYMWNILEKGIPVTI